MITRKKQDDEYRHLRSALAALVRRYGREVVLAHLVGPVPSATHRSGDRDTSVAAGERHALADVRRFSMRSRQAKMLLAFDAHGPLTAHEAAVVVMREEQTEVDGHWAVPRFEGCRRRVSDLVRAGYIEDSGGRECNPGSSDEAVLWELTSLGATAVNNLYDFGWSTRK